MPFLLRSVLGTEESCVTVCTVLVVLVGVLNSVRRPRAWSRPCFLMAARGLATVMWGDLNFELKDSDVLQGMPQVSWPSLARLVGVCSSARREVAICAARPSHSRLACIFRPALRLKKHWGICEILHHADSHCVFAASTILAFLKATKYIWLVPAQPHRVHGQFENHKGPPLLISRFEIVSAKVKRKLLRQFRLLPYKEHSTGKLLGVLFVHVRQKRLDRKAKDVHNALWASCEETSNRNLLHIEGDCTWCSWQVFSGNSKSTSMVASSGRFT